ncbi:hypothetical protein E3N88_32696 [Mikania micrantha]|uniref:Uncharacterized protein n=1 Tax=Mikania micrantha TaxID=192012 RepID=A0A5N6M9S8_9ASTR|nr:hypothetical protein E3N88_32696 [Mikania micrantha]
MMINNGITILSSNARIFSSSYTILSKIEDHLFIYKRIVLDHYIIESRTESNPNIEEQKPFPTTIPKKPRRGRKSEAAAIEDFIRSSLEETFAAIGEQNSEVLNGSEGVIRDKVHDDDEDEDDGKKKKGMVVEEEDPDWPVDAEIGWGISASDYFEKHPIKNVIGEDGVEIDWEGELDDNLVKEINCLEREAFALQSSPLIVLVFERYNRYI